MRSRNFRGFTMIELLVVISIIALLIAILMPAVGKARDAAYVSRSQANMRQLAIAHATYAAEWNDNQWTLAPHTLMSYALGGTVLAAALAYNQAHGDAPGIPISEEFGVAVEVGYAYKSTTQQAGNWILVSVDNPNALISPLLPGEHRGSYRLMQAPSFNQYVGGRWFDRTFFAPKDTTPVTQSGECFDAPGQFCIQSLVFAQTGSYILSTAAMYSPEVFSLETFTAQDMYAMPSLFRSPTYSQARFPELKTHIVERHWLQNARTDCNPMIPPPAEDLHQCQPYWFNAAPESTPVALFYDGHVASISVSEALDANSQAMGQAGEEVSLWHHKSAWQTHNHFFHHVAYTPNGSPDVFGTDANPTSSFHILTRHGILGRDTFNH